MSLLYSDILRFVLFFVLYACTAFLASSLSFLSLSKSIKRLEAPNNTLRAGCLEIISNNVSIKKFLINSTLRIIKPITPKTMPNTVIPAPAPAVPTPTSSPNDINKDGIMLI